MSSPGSSPPTAAAGASSRLAMSRALGAAFLSHQVEELERAVASSSHNHVNARRGGGRGRGRGGGGGGGQVARRGGHRPQTSDDASGEDQGAMLPPGVSVVVLDTSILVHSGGTVKRWCQAEAGPDLVVPLEVLNSLDLLKKGSSLLAQRARGASRLLESFVGSGTRLRVQRDDAFVLWDDLQLSTNNGSDSDSDDILIPPPEWLRRTLCCAHYELRAGTVLVAVSEQLKSIEDATPGRYDARVDGMLVKHWAPRVALRVISVKPSTTKIPGGGGGHGPSNRDSIPLDAPTPTAVAPDVVPAAIPIVAPSTVPRARGKQLFDPKHDEPFGYADPMHPDSPRFSPRPAARSKVVVPAPVPAPPPPPRKREDQQQPVRVVRLLARGEKLDP